LRRCGITLVISPGLGGINVLANGSSAYPKAPGNGTDASSSLPVFKNFSDISHHEPPSCHRLNLLISKAKPMMIRLAVPVHPGAGT